MLRSRRRVREIDVENGIADGAIGDEVVEVGAGCDASLRIVIAGLPGKLIVVNHDLRNIRRGPHAISHEVDFAHGDVTFRCKQSLELDLRLRVLVKRRTLSPENENSFLCLMQR